MARTPPPPPHGTVTVNGQTYPVKFSDAMIKWLLDASYTTETNIGSVNSGVAQARADAAAAQASADAANQAAAGVAASVASGDLGAGTMSLSVSPFNAGGTRSGTGAKTTNTVTVTVTGGTGPFTYAWSYVSGDTFTITAASAATTAFTGTITALGQDKTAIYKCTVTDTGTGDVQTINVGVNISEIS